jgi:hypothetical protein
MALPVPQILAEVAVVLVETALVLQVQAVPV